MLSYANKLIGVDDATVWWQENIDVFNHDRFTEMIVPFVDNFICQAFDRAMESANANEDTVWAHTHPYWQRKFGVYIVRHGREIIYEGRNEREVASLLTGDTKTNNNTSNNTKNSDKGKEEECP